MKVAPGVRQVVIEPEFEAWRKSARGLLEAGVQPEEVDLIDGVEAHAGLLFGTPGTEPSHAGKNGKPRVPAEFV